MKRTGQFQGVAQVSPRTIPRAERPELGLALVKNFIEAQGGHAGPDFPDQGGSVFWFELRAAPEA
jgi:signal transduction histidine kinase